MDTDNQFISTLRIKEKELEAQLEALRTTIKMFDKQTLNGSLAENKIQDQVGQSKLIPRTFEDAETWKQKILFALGKINSGVVQDIVDELKKHMPDEDDDVLFKKITSYASVMRKDRILVGKPVGNKFEYFIK